MRLLIGGPARDTGPVSFAFDLAQLYAHTRECGPWGRAVSLGFIGSTYVHVGREAVLEGALQGQATHVLWLDTDMTFPPETAIRLARHNRPIVAGNYVIRHPRRLFTAERGGQRIATTLDTRGLEAVDSVGMGVLLLQLDVVADLPRPWFRHGVNPATGADVGEDRMFCRALRAAGHQIYIDHDLSKELGHVGHHTYRSTDDTVPALAV